MYRELVISPDPIDEPALVASRRADAGQGAVVCFAGLVRGREGERPIDGLGYEAFVEMAERQFHRLLDELAVRFPVASVRLVHRTGLVRVNEASLWVEIIAPHRGEALGACGWLIDEMKRVIPIWKHPVPPASPPAGIPA